VNKDYQKLTKGKQFLATLWHHNSILRRWAKRSVENIKNSVGQIECWTIFLEAEYSRNQTQNAPYKHAAVDWRLRLSGLRTWWTQLQAKQGKCLCHI